MQQWIDSLDKNLISCVLPTFNRPTFLKLALNHLHRQIRDNLEIIIVDDGSCHDHAKENQRTVEAYEDLGLDIKYIYLTKNSGSVSIPRNIGISWAEGRTIAPIDDDCLCLDNKFNDLYCLLWSSPTNIMAYGGRNMLRKYGSEYEYIGNSMTDSFILNKTDLGIDNGQFIYKADVYAFINPVFAINACDWETYRAFAPYGNFVFSNSIVCDYYWHGENSSLVPKEKRVDPMDILQNYVGYFKEGLYKEKVESLLK
jgi:glycosyltransferase involved in cell wall biosynthesis